MLHGAEIVGAIMQQVVGDGLEMRTKKIPFAKLIKELCVQQSEDEMKLHGELPKHLRRVLKKKRLLLFKQLLQDEVLRHCVCPGDHYGVFYVQHVSRQETGASA